MVQMLSSEEAWGCYGRLLEQLQLVCGISKVSLFMCSLPEIMHISKTPCKVLHGVMKCRTALNHINIHLLGCCILLLTIQCKESFP